MRGLINPVRVIIAQQNLPTLYSKLIFRRPIVQERDKWKALSGVLYTKTDRTKSIRARCGYLSPDKRIYILNVLNIYDNTISVMGDSFPM